MGIKGLLSPLKLGLSRVQTASFEAECIFQTRFYDYPP